MNARKRSAWVLIVPILLAGLLLYILYWRGLVSSIRFFDVDEFSYMHWTAEVARGERIYTDFFSYFTPGFMWAFAPLFWIYGTSVQVFTAGRMLSFGIFLSLVGCIGYFFGITRGWKWALLPMVILAFLPMPFDKFLEIRPDNLATLLSVIGVIALVRGIRETKTVWWVVSGFAFSLSLFVLAKTVPIVAVAAGIVLLSSRKKFLYFLLALIVPWLLFFAGSWIQGNFRQVWYSVTQLPFEVYRSVLNYPMEANLFFHPNTSFYGIGQGWTIGLIVNNLLWILAVIVATHRVVTPFREGKKENALIELLIGGVFFVSIFGYVKFFPLKHSQYLIPIAIFVAYYAADGLSVVFDWFTRKGGYETATILLIGFVYLLGVATKDVNAPKLLSTNEGQLLDLARLMRTIPFTARVVDIEGRMVFWPGGYPVSSLPIDSTLEFVTQRPAPLATYLSQTPSDYIWDGDSGRLRDLLPENYTYIQAHYTPVAGWGNRLWARLR